MLPGRRFVFIASAISYCIRPPAGARASSLCVRLAFVAVLADRVLCGCDLENGLFTCLLMLARDQQLVEDVVCLVKVEDHVKLAHIAEVSVEDLNELMDDLQRDQLVVLVVHARDEVQTCISLKDDLVILPLEKVAE